MPVSVCQPKGMKNQDKLLYGFSLVLAHEMELLAMTKQNTIAQNLIFEQFSAEVIPKHAQTARFVHVFLLLKSEFFAP